MNNFNNYNYTKHALYDECVGSNDTHKYFSDENVSNISSRITNLLKGVDCSGRDIVVPNNTIINVMNSVYTNAVPEIGDIYSRYNIPIYHSDRIQRMVEKVINIITTDVKINMKMEDNNSKLNIWTTVLGNFNEHGLRSHPPIKLRNNRPQQMAFNMNY